MQNVLGFFTWSQLVSSFVEKCVQHSPLPEAVACAQALSLPALVNKKVLADGTLPAPMRSVQ
jgi:hypothetical protein